MRVFFCLTFATLSFFSQSQIASGPMLGYTETREVLIWIQTKGSQELAVSYSSSEAHFTTSSVETRSASAYTAKFILSDLSPGTSYSYHILVNGVITGPSYTFTTQALWQHRKPAPDFTMLTGSCAYINEPEFDRPGTPYGKSLDVFDAMASKEPDMMLWLGDNIYLREVDFTTYSGFLHRYSHTRSQPELQGLLQICPNYAIWDDHDYGPNDGNRSYIHKDWAQKAFELFWGNPSYGLPDLNGGITTSFSFNDIDYFLLDNRYFRSDHTVKQDKQGIFGEDQSNWLIEALKFSKSPFKIVATGGQFLSSFAEYENHSLFKEERKNLIRRIEKEGITGVIFLSGDRHSTELSLVKLKKGNMIYDLTASPLTSGSYDHNDEPNKNRVDGTMVCTQNFAALSFTGDQENRKCTITVFDNFGEELWSKTIEKW